MTQPSAEETTLSMFNRLPAYDRLIRAELSEEFFDLARFQRFLDKVGNPEKGLPVIHVRTGTIQGVENDRSRSA